MSVSVLVSTFESVALLLGIGVLGTWVIGKRILPREALGLLSILALDISLPSLVFVNIIKDFKPSEFEGWWLLPLWWAGETVIFGVLTALSSLVAKRETRREFAASLFFQNALFFPLAILTSLYGAGSSYIVDLFFFQLFFPSLLFSTAHLFFGQPTQALNWGKIINRVLLATLAATALRLTGTQMIIPGFAVSALEMVGNMALPLLMLILGGNMYVDYKEQGRLFPGEILKFILIKNFFFPLTTLALLILVHPAYHISLMVILQAAVPPVTAVPILTDRAGGQRDIVNQFMFSSFAVSLFSIPLMMGLFGMFFQPPSP